MIKHCNLEWIRGKISLTQYTGILQPGLSQIFVHPDPLGSGINYSFAIYGGKLEIFGGESSPPPPPVDWTLTTEQNADLDPEWLELIRQWAAELLKKQITSTHWNSVELSCKF